MEPVQLVQMNISQSNTYKKYLAWRYFDEEPRVQEKQEVKDEQSHIHFSVVCPGYSYSSYEHEPRHDNSIPCMVVW